MKIENPLLLLLVNFIPLEDANQMQLGMGCVGNEDGKNTK